MKRWSSKAAVTVHFWATKYTFRIWSLANDNILTHYAVPTITKHSHCLSPPRASREWCHINPWFPLSSTLPPAIHRHPSLTASSPKLDVPWQFSEHSFDFSTNPIMKMEQVRSPATGVVYIPNIDNYVAMIQRKPLCVRMVHCKWARVMDRPNIQWSATGKPWQPNVFSGNWKSGSLMNK